MLKFNYIIILILISKMQATIAFELAHHYSSLSLLDDSLYNYKANNNSHNIDENINNNNNNDESDIDAINSSDDLIYLERKSIDSIANANKYYHNEDGQHNNNNNDNNEQIKCNYVDFTDFIALIPSAEVQETVGHYYYQDREVQRAFTYFYSKDFIVLKEKILNIHEVDVFLKYLNSIGFDVIQFIHTLVKLIGNPEQFVQSQINGSGESENTTEKADNMSGLHGLVDSILDIFPQDQVLSLFFDKMETSVEFSKFIENIGSEKFNRILHDMENSTDLKMLVYTLHNNGIYVTRIVDSLKAYFFLA